MLLTDIPPIAEGIRAEEIRAAMKCTETREEIVSTVTKPITHLVEKIDKICHDLPWPLSWLCDIVKTMVEVIEWVVETIVTVIVTVVCVLITIAEQLLTLGAGLVQLLGSLPIIGPIARWVVGAVSWLVDQLVGLADGLAGLFGILPIKNLDLHVIILRGPDGALVRESEIQPVLRETERIYRARARVAVTSTVHTVTERTPDNALHIDAGVGLLGEDLTGAGFYFQEMMTRYLPDSNLQRLLRLAVPIVAFVVEGVGDTDTGCSAGPLADYVVVEAAQLRPVPKTGNLMNTLSHEMGHSCGLLHTDDLTNLMNPTDNSGSRGDNLSPFQRLIVRSSTHVTYF